MERMWFYAQGQEKKGPMPESELKALVAAGRVGAADLVWTEGMPNWMAVESVAELRAQSESPTSVAVAIAAPSGATLPGGLLGWMNFVGVITLIGGIFQCITCVGIFYGIFAILAGTGLMGARAALAGVTEVDAKLSPFFLKLKTYMQMTGIFYIVMFVLTILMMIVYFGVIAAAVAAGLNQAK